MKRSPILLLTMGDPAGIGPEITVKALCNNINRPYHIIVIGDLEILQKAAQTCNLSPQFNLIDDTDNFEFSFHRDKEKSSSALINVLTPTTTPQFIPGAPQASCGHAAYQYITKAIELTLKKKADAVVTNPISKESLKLAGINYPGHTEIFADKTGTTDYSMVFLLDGVAVAHVTTHVSLRQAIDLITKDRVLRQIKLLHRSLKNLGITPPRMAVGGLNPHAGENGLFGDEEINEIIPAVNEARAAGIDITGPLPPDTVFTRAFNGEFNGVVSMLHDHGFVALKSRDFEHGVNITVGLPIIRTSVGHGTAFDRAWMGGDVSVRSLVTAMGVACRMCGGRPGGSPNFPNSEQP